MCLFPRDGFLVVCKAHLSRRDCQTPAMHFCLSNRNVQWRRHPRNRVSEQRNQCCVHICMIANEKKLVVARRWKFNLQC